MNGVKVANVRGKRVDSAVSDLSGLPPTPDLLLPCHERSKRAISGRGCLHGTNASPALKMGLRVPPGRSVVGIDELAVDPLRMPTC
jgi:hypothetical protein